MSAAATMSMNAPALSNGDLVRRLFGLAWRYRLHCLRVLVVQIALLTMGISGLSLTGVGIDYIKHRMDGTPLADNALHLHLPETWPYWQVLGLLAGIILVLAVCRAYLNYAYAVSVNRLVQQRLVVDLRGEVYDKLQRLSFRFFDANNTSSIITRVTSDVNVLNEMFAQGVVGLFQQLFSLVVIIGLFDLLGMVQAVSGDPDWHSSAARATGYLFVGFIYWSFCFGMSRYSAFLERRNKTGWPY